MAAVAPAANPAEAPPVTFSLFPGATNPNAFDDCISRRQELHERPGVQNMLGAAEEIVKFATNKYQQQLDKGEWKPAQPEPNEDIIALKAEVERLKNSKSKIEWTKAAWKSTVPTNGQPKVKSTNRKTYHCCPNHKERTFHKTGEFHKVSNGAPAAQATQTESTHGDPAICPSEARTAIALQN